jgi:hypothetical protein
MNNSDNNDFKNWQNGDDEDPLPKGFFFYNGNNENFKKLWNDIYNGRDINESINDHLNMDDIMNNFYKNSYPYNPNNPKANYGSYKNNSRKNSRAKNKNNFTQEDYLKLIEIRGYLAITEQFAHVKALDKLLDQIIIVPDNKDKK